MIGQSDSVSPESAKKRRLKHLLILWIGAFFFHAVADPVVTYIAVTLLEAGVETNPFIRGWLNQGIGMFVLIHIPLFILGVVGWMILRWLIKQELKQEQKSVYYLSVIALVVINLWGAILVLNNLWVIWIMG
jgi:hypothetical protein